jgi:peptidyl-prolyl cis-trans isomerase B (cyclophilin B)
MRLVIFAFVFIYSFSATAQQPIFVSIKTNYGTMIAKLADEAPVHRDNFARLARKHYFDKTYFHRVVPRFVIQGGDPDSIFTTPSDTNVLKANRLMPEFHPALFHKRGALAMGSDDNVLKASFFTQFYIVQGRKYTDAEMDSVEKKRLQGRKINAERREIYKTIGGTPQLDGNYTVFGEIVKGMEVVDAIAAVEAVAQVPRERIGMKVRVLKKAKARKLGLATP